MLSDHRFEGLARLAFDEASLRKGRYYPTVVADHDREGRVVWAQAGKSTASLISNLDELGLERVTKLGAISFDMDIAFQNAVNEQAAHVRQCIDAIRIIALANEAINQARH
jgi:transposase